MIRLNHINLSVKDVIKAGDFFVKYFEFTRQEGRASDKLTILNGRDGFLLVLMHEQMNENGNHDYPDAFHIGFYLDNEHAVNEMYALLQSDGFVLNAEPKQIRKTFGFYFRLQNILIEIVSEIG